MIINRKPIISLFILSDIGYWFWFFQTIITLYLIYPVIRTWLKHTKITWIIYFLLIWLLSISINYWAPDTTIISTDFIFIYVGYPIIGYLLTKIDLSKYKNFGLLAYILSALLIFTLTILYTNQDNLVQERWFIYLSPLVIINSIGLIIFIKQICLSIKIKYIISMRNFLSNHSYGIFFLHPLIISRFYFLHNTIHPIFSDWIIFGLGIIITSVIIYILSKIPYIKSLAG